MTVGLLEMVERLKQLDGAVDRNKSLHRRRTSFDRIGMAVSRRGFGSFHGLQPHTAADEASSFFCGPVEHEERDVQDLCNFRGGKVDCAFADETFRGPLQGEPI